MKTRSATFALLLLYCIVTAPNKVNADNLDVGHALEYAQDNCTGGNSEYPRILDDSWRRGDASSFLCQTLLAGCIGVCAYPLEVDPTLPCAENTVVFLPHPTACRRIGDDEENPEVIAIYGDMFAFLDAHFTPILHNDSAEPICGDIGIRPPGAFVCPEEISQYEGQIGGPIVPGVICMFLVYDSEHSVNVPVSFAMGLEYQEGQSQTGVNLMLYGHDLGFTGDTEYCGPTLQQHFQDYGYYGIDHSSEHSFDYVMLYEPTVSAELMKQLSEFIQHAGDKPISIAKEK